MGDIERNANALADNDGAAIRTLLLGASPTQHEGCPGCWLKQRKARSPNALPYRDFSIIALLCLVNSLPISSLFAYVYFLVQDLGIAQSPTQIGMYVGFLGSSLLVGRFMSSTVWGIVADRYGHKPVMYIGTASTVIFMSIFGFSTNYWIALFSRFLTGFANGMMATIRAYAVDICSPTHQAFSLSIVSTMWAVGLIIGPAIGGYLAQPSEKLPMIFPSGSLFDRFPYALPSLCISLVAMTGFVMCFWLPSGSMTGTFILVNNSVVSTERGTANGISTSVMSIFQAMGPACAGALFSWSEERMDASFLPGVWMVFSILGALSFIAFLNTFEICLPSSLNKSVEDELDSK